MEDITAIRGTLFLTALFSFFLWETLAPRKTLTQSRYFRWANNLGLVWLNNLTIFLVMPLVAFEVAVWSTKQGFGLFNFLEFNTVLNIILSVLLLDLVIYFQHRLFHTIPILWRLHRVHHADQDIDVTTGSRFHPIEIVLSMLIKMLAVLVLGVSPVAIVIFEIILNVSAMFNHSNIKFPLKLDKLFRKIIVTPDMHRVHHSIYHNETDSNYGFFLSTWDRFFGTYISTPKDGHTAMKIGINTFRSPKEQRLDKMLTQPFRDN